MKDHSIRELAVGFIFLVLGCQKNPTAVYPAKGYFLYVGNRGGYHEVFVIDTDRNQVVDTINFPNAVGTLAITKSGAKLYVSSGIISSVDLKTKNPRIIYDESQVAILYSAPDGSIFVISRTHDQAPWTWGTIDTLSDVVNIIDTLDFELVASGDQEVAFAPNAPVLFTVNKERKLYAYNYATKRIIKRYQNLYQPLHMVISHDGKRMYCLVYPYTLVVFDLDFDSVIAAVGANHIGRLALSPDGRHLYVTDPQRMNLEPVSTGKVYIFDTGTNSYVGNIDMNPAVPFGRSPATDHIILMPNGKTAYVSNWVSLVFVVDLQSRKVITAIEPRPTEVQLAPMVLGPKQ